MNMTRRSFLKMGAMAGVGLALPVGALSRPFDRIGAAGSVISPSVEPFEVPLPAPSVLKPVHTDSTTDHYEVTQKARTLEILPGMKTEVWGYDGLFPGPTVEARSGRKVVIRQMNELPVPVSSHLHGGRTPPGSDGYPTDLILPSGSGSSLGHDHGGHTVTTSDGFKDYEYPNEQRAAALWYHDHRMDFTGPQNYRGLLGMYIIRDEIEDELPLPKGEKEVPLIIADRIFNEDGSFYYPSIDPSLTGQGGVIGAYANGVFGDTVLVNGAPWPVMEASNTRYRFRILNASNAQVYDLALDPPPPGGKPFVQVGSDGGLLESPVSHDRILTSPAERFDVVVDFSRYPVGTEVTLKNLEGEGKTRDVMRFVVARKEKDESAVPDALAPRQDYPDPEAAGVTRRFEFRNGNQWGGMSTVNGKMFDPERMDASPRLDSTEVWEFVSDGEHPIHLHLVHFKVMSRNGGEPGPYDAGWKDTVLLRANERVRMAARFEGYRGKYVFHCHNLEHEDMMMMANFEVI